MLLREAGFVVSDADNAVLPGLEHVRSRLSSGNVELLAGAAPELEREMMSYAWDERAQSRGEDKPGSTTDDHACDALRYALFMGSDPEAEVRELDALRARHPDVDWMDPMFDGRPGSTRWVARQRERRQLTA